MLVVLDNIKPGVVRIVEVVIFFLPITWDVRGAPYSGNPETTEIKTIVSITCYRLIFSFRNKNEQTVGNLEKLYSIKIPQGDRKSYRVILSIRK